MVKLFRELCVSSSEVTRESKHRNDENQIENQSEENDLPRLMVMTVISKDVQISICEKCSSILF